MENKTVHVCYEQEMERQKYYNKNKIRKFPPYFFQFQNKHVKPFPSIQQTTKIEALKKWCGRKLLCIPWAAKRTNKSILLEIGEKKTNKNKNKKKNPDSSMQL